jgi:hypothetical protein
MVIREARRLDHGCPCVKTLLDGQIIGSLIYVERLVRVAKSADHL